MMPSPRESASGSHAHRLARKQDEKSPDWQARLPAAWRKMVERPLFFTTYHEHEMPASRTFGFDENDLPCYYRHAFVLTTLAADDDIELFEAIVYTEEVQSWRLCDGRWLIWRKIRRDEEGLEARTFFSFSEQMPR